MAALYCVSGARSYAQLDHALEEKNQETGLGGLAHFGYVEMMNGLLPPGFLDELRTRLSIGQVIGRRVTWDQRKSNPGKGDLWAPCPFHQEKSASFHVDDRKGYYYCFGCHAKGDAISFVRETENVGFMEAVRILADEAGMTMPARDPEAQKKVDRRKLLADVMEQAVLFYRLQLKTGAGTAARDYLAGRGLRDEALDRWEIGFAPPGWQNLWDLSLSCNELHLSVARIANIPDSRSNYLRLSGVPNSHYLRL